MNTFHFWLTLNKQKNKSMGNCLSKFNDKTFTFQYTPSAPGHFKKLLSGVQKNRVKYFASGVHQEHGYEKITQTIKSSPMNVYNRFPLKSFELLDGGASIIKSSVIKK